VTFALSIPARLGRYVAVKGSICIDGVSLTVNHVGAQRFGVNIVPHALKVTTLGELAVGRLVNIEVDLLARYLERLLDERLLGEGFSGEAWPAARGVDGASEKRL